MDIVFKVCGTILSVMILFVTGLAFSISNAAEINTNNYFESVSRTVIESNYNDTIIDTLIEDAADQGHTLTIDVYGLGRTGEKKYADIRLKYKYTVDLFDISLERTKQKVL